MGGKERAAAGLWISGSDLLVKREGEVDMRGFARCVPVSWADLAAGGGGGGCGVIVGMAYE